MAGSVNKLIIVGNLGADPEIRSMPNGGKVANLRVACTDSWREKSTGERKERTEWISVVIFSEGLVKVAESYLRKGSKVYIEGQLQTRKWGKDGVDHYKTECVVQGFNSALVMLDGPQNDRAESHPQPRMSADKSKRPAPSFDIGGTDWAPAGPDVGDGDNYQF